MKSSALVLILASTCLSNASPESDLLRRTVPALSERISFSELPAATQDTFQIGHSGGKIVISGSNTSARCAGLRWYLAHHCGMHFSWSGDQTAVTSPLPMPDEEPRSSPWKWRSAHNHCVFSYSMAFWDWPRWERELDFLALHGFNQAAVYIGHEKVWQNTLRRLGFTDAQIATWLPSTTHTSWWHLDNLQGYGGPLTQYEIDSEAALGRKVADRMREFGIEPIGVGFYGMVPDFFGQKFPQAHILPQGEWPFAGSFPRPPVLDPTDPAFAGVAAVYYEELQKVLGPVKQFGGDLFHEGGKSGGIDLPKAYRAVQDAMVASIPDATWVMFGWTGNPRQDGLNALDPAHALVQQTSKNLGTAVPVSGNFRDYGGKIPWTWQIIDNFGGNHGLYGNFETVATLPSRFLNGGVPGKFSGLGHCPEGIETNPMQAALYYDMLWRSSDVDVASWLDEAVAARYGKPSRKARAAWELLARSSYRCPIEQEGIADHIFATRPKAGASHARTWSSNTAYWCESDVLDAALELRDAAPALSANANYRYDLVDVIRQALNFHSKHVYDAMMAAFQRRDRAAFDRESKALLGLFDDIDSLLASNDQFLFGTFLARAKAKGDTPESQARIQRNGRNLITLWSGKPDALDDYASRSWAGLVKNYYKPRWSIFLDDLHKGWDKPGIPAYTGGDFERSFLDDKTVFPASPSGDTVAISRDILQRLEEPMRASASLRWSLPQESAAPTELKFDITGRLKPGTAQTISLSREFGDASARLLQLSIRADGQTLFESTEPRDLGKAITSFNPPVLSFAPAARLILTLQIQGPGHHAVANGPITITERFDTERKDYLGRFTYLAEGKACIRELKDDGSITLTLGSAPYGGWAGFKWKFENGEALLYRADGSLFERHRLLDADTLAFTLDTHLGPAKRMR